MQLHQGQVLHIKIGQVEQLAFADGTSMETAIRKQPVSSVRITRLGPEGDSVGLKAHHGGVDKAVFFMAADSFAALNRLTGSAFRYDGQAVYGENFVVSGLAEAHVCVGDVYQIGGCVLEISQPRRPCSRLSRNTGYARMQDTVFESGLTGWYARVLGEGTASTGDAIILQQRSHPQWSIQALNRLLSSPEIDAEQIGLALDCAPLAAAFKQALKKKLNGDSGKVAG